MTTTLSPEHIEAASPSPAPASSAHTKRPTRRTGAFVSPTARRRWWLIFGLVCAIALLACNKRAYRSSEFWRIWKRVSF